MRKLIGGAVLVLVSMAGCGEEYDATPSKNTAGRSSAGSSASGGSGGGDAGSESTSGGGGADAGAGGDGGSGGANAGTGGSGGAVGPASVRGLLRSGGLPVAGVTVVIDEQSDLTDENGAYAFEGVKPAYRLVLIQPGVISVYDDVTTREPVTNLPGGEKPSAASVAGQLSGAGVPLPAGHRAAVSFVADDSALSGHTLLTEGATSYALDDLSWSGPESLDGELQALKWKDGATGPELYSGFATKALQIQDGVAHGAADGSVPETNLAFEDPEEVTAMGSIAAVPSTMNVPSIELFVGRIPVPATLAVGAFSVVVPTTPLPVALTVTGTNKADSGTSSVTVMRPKDGAWEIALPKTPRLVLPVDQAQHVSATTNFSWTDVPANVVVTVTWRVDNLTVRRTTTEKTAKLPDLEPYGVPYKGGLQDSWDVQGLGPAATVDELMALEDSLYGTSQPRDLTTVRSASRSMKLAE